MINVRLLQIPRRSFNKIKYYVQVSVIVQSIYSKKMFICSKNKKKIKKNNENIQTKFEAKSHCKLNNVSNINSFIEKSTSEQTIDDNLPSTVTLLRTPDGGKCYLIGTTHFSIDSENEVSRIIQSVQPDIVTIELCLGRIDVLKIDEEIILKEATNFKFSDILYTIKTNGLNKGLIFLLTFKLIVNLTKSLGLAPGGEFRKALIEIKKIPNCYLHMGDRPINITFARAFSFLTWWQKIKIAWQLLTQNTKINHEDIKKYKSRDLVEEMMMQLAEEYPALGEVFIKERDMYLTHSLQLACKPRVGKDNEQRPVNVVGIVGMGHVTGIVKNWGKIKDIQIPPIMSIPPSSVSSKIFVLTIKTFAVGSIIYISYKIIPILISVLLFFKSTIQEFI